jgi:hypothetical protein
MGITGKDKNALYDERLGIPTQKLLICMQQLSVHHITSLGKHLQKLCQ